jgi:hypothetical protein
MDLPRWNTNTLLGVGTFVVLCSGLIWTQAQTNARFEIQAQQWTQFQQRQQSWNDNLDVDRKASRASYEQQLRDLLGVITKLGSVNDNTQFQVGQLQKSDEITDARITRITDVYGKRFEDLIAALNELKTSQALTQQTLGEVKAILTPARPLARQ